MREAENPQDDSHIFLLNSIRDLYTKKGNLAYGKFEPEKDIFPFQKLLERFYKEDKLQKGEPSDLFLRFSRQAMKQFEVEISKSTLATGGYILFIYYQENGDKFMMVVMLKDKDAPIVEANLTIGLGKHLELGKLHFAARVNILRWRESPEQNYLSFVKRQEAKEVSLYFRNFIGCTDYSDSKQQTRSLIKAIHKSLKEQSLNSDELAEKKHDIHQYLDSLEKKDESVDLETRSEEHTSELQSHSDLVCRLLLEKKKQQTKQQT